jgi:hypothetical protein
MQPMRALVIDEIGLGVGFKSSANPVLSFEYGERQSCLLKTLASGQPRNSRAYHTDIEHFALPYGVEGLDDRFHETDHMESSV